MVLTSLQCGTCMAHTLSHVFECKRGADHTPIWYPCSQSWQTLRQNWLLQERNADVRVNFMAHIWLCSVKKIYVSTLRAERSKTTFEHQLAQAAPLLHVGDTHDLAVACMCYSMLSWLSNDPLGIPNITLMADQSTEHSIYPATTVPLATAPTIYSGNMPLPVDNMFYVEWQLCQGCAEEGWHVW